MSELNSNCPFNAQFNQERWDKTIEITVFANVLRYLKFSCFRTCFLCSIAIVIEHVK